MNFHQSTYFRLLLKNLVQSKDVFQFYVYIFSSIPRMTICQKRIVFCLGFSQHQQGDKNISYCENFDLKFEESAKTTKRIIMWKQFFLIKLLPSVFVSERKLSWKNCLLWLDFVFCYSKRVLISFALVRTFNFILYFHEVFWLYSFLL